MPSYEIRYFFDPGSNVCLWAKNFTARERFGYPINHWELPLSENAKRWLQYLIAWFDTSIDWSAPSDSNHYWSPSEIEQFKVAAQKGFEFLCQELPSSQYSLVNESFA